jgi:GntR family transcriptional regulator/MocR family aminotransferase
VPIDWASSVDLHVELKSAGGGRRAALERALREAIRDGRLHPGDRVPSTRALAHDLGLARGTVAEAYAQLAAEGYLRTRAGAPTRVAAAFRAPERAPAAPERASPRYTLMPGQPDLSGFSRAAWIGALRQALATAPDAALGMREGPGRPELRAALAAYLGRTRGVLADPERIVICSGFTQGLALLCRALGGTLAMEDPCLDQLRDVVRASGARVAALEVDEHGARPQLPPRATAALLTPAHQFPLGATLAPERRAAFVAWARESGGVVIEDDYDGEFRYDRQPVGALQGLDPGHVVYAGTASKTLAPGLRLGWLVVPDRLLEPVLEAKRLAGATHALEQLALAELLGSGAYDRHVRRMRQRYRRRREALLETLAGRRTHGVAAGLQIVVEVDSEERALARAAERSLAIDGLARYWHAPRERPQALVVGFGAPPEHAYRATLDALAEIM